MERLIKDKKQHRAMVTSLERTVLKESLLLPARQEYPDIYFEVTGLLGQRSEDRASVTLLVQLEGLAPMFSDGYAGNLTHEQALQLNAKLGNETASPLQFADAINYLRLGKAYDGTGKHIRPARSERLLNNLLHPNKWRAEYLNAKFTQQDNQLYIVQSTVKDGQLQWTQEPLEPCIMRDCSIDLTSVNRQGMPTRSGDDVYFQYPRDGRVARFGAGAGGADLFGSRDPRSSGSALGVRVARLRGLVITGLE